MKTICRNLLTLGILVCALAFALPSQAQGRHSDPWSKAKGPSAPKPTSTCFTYSNDLRYCNVVKIKNGQCVHNRWGQYHNGQTGPDCDFCYDTVNNAYDFLVDHYTTPLEEGCFPYNDCQTGTV